MTRTDAGVESSKRKRGRPPASLRTYKSMRTVSATNTSCTSGFKHIPTTTTTLPPGTECVKFGAQKLAFEPRHFCCCDGAVHIAANPTPQELINLYNGTNASAVHFQNYTRIYNNLFAFSSLGGNTSQSTSKHGIYVFRLQGQLYHYVPDLIPTTENPRYLQLYFYDTDHEMERRMGSFSQLKPETMATISTVMERNPYALFFRTLREFDITEETEIIISHNPTLDQHIYNAPTTNEVAAILPDTTSSNQNNSPHISVFGKSNISHRVMHYYGCYDPLQYPILYPHGDCGWHQGLKKQRPRQRQSYSNPTFPISTALVQTAEDLILAEETASHKQPPKDGKEISCREYYAYKFQIRPGAYII